MDGFGKRLISDAHSADRLLRQEVRDQQARVPLQVQSAGWVICYGGLMFMFIDRRDHGARAPRVQPGAQVQQCGRVLRGPAEAGRPRHAGPAEVLKGLNMVMNMVLINNTLFPKPKYIYAPSVKRVKC